MSNIPRFIVVQWRHRKLPIQKKIEHHNRWNTNWKRSLRFRSTNIKIESTNKYGALALCYIIVSAWNTSFPSARPPVWEPGGDIRPIHVSECSVSIPHCLFASNNGREQRSSAIVGFQLSRSALAGNAFFESRTCAPEDFPREKTLGRFSESMFKVNGMKWIWIGKSSDFIIVMVRVCWNLSIFNMKN